MRIELVNPSERSKWGQKQKPGIKQQDKKDRQKEGDLSLFEKMLREAEQNKKG